jgi:hypothetical protein
VGTSRAIVAPGMRTEVASGWRADVATVSATLRTSPRLIVPGMLGFALRGGILFLVLPILVLPTSVEVRLLLGGNIGTNGLEPSFLMLVAAISAVTLGGAMIVLYLIARCELALFTRFVNSPSPNGGHVWPLPGRLLPDDRSAIAGRLFVVEALALLAVLLAALPLAAALGEATISEVLLPSSSASIYSRIVSDVAVPLAGWAVAIVLIEVVSAVAVRHALAGAFGLRGHFRILHHPLRLLAVGVVGWLLFIGTVAVVYAGLSACWVAVESVFLTTGLSGDVRELVSAIIVAVLLGVAFSAALFAGGLVSAFRAGLWTLASLR